MPEEGTYGVICEEPDAKVLSWEEVLFIGHNVMMNKPSVLSTGEWLFFDRGVGEQLEIVICSARGSFHKKTLRSFFKHFRPLFNKRDKSFFQMIRQK